MYILYNMPNPQQRIQNSTLTYLQDCWPQWVTSLLPGAMTLSLSPGVLHSTWMWQGRILTSGTLFSSPMWQMRITQQLSPVLTVTPSHSHTTPSPLTTPVPVTTTALQSSHRMELGMGAAVNLCMDTFLEVSGKCVHVHAWQSWKNQDRSCNLWTAV